MTLETSKEVLPSPATSKNPLNVENPVIKLIRKLCLLLAILALASSTTLGQVVINEIFFDPEDDTHRTEFIELYNSGSSSVSLTGWYFDSGVSYTFPSTSLAAGAYIIVAQNPADVNAYLNPQSPVVGPWTGTLSNSGEDISLWNASNQEIDFVDYGVGGEWPNASANGADMTLQLVNADFDNALPVSWGVAMPSAGAANSAVLESNASTNIDDVDHDPAEPNSGQSVLVTADVYDPVGVSQVTLMYQIVDPGSYIRKSDPAFSTNWTALAMRDNGTGGDAVAGDGEYSVTIPASLNQHRRMIRYRIQSTNNNSESRTVPALTDPVPNFAYYTFNGPGNFVSNSGTYNFQQTEYVQTLQLLTTQADVNAYIFAYTGQDYPGQGTLVYDGDVYDHIGFRARGDDSRHTRPKRNLKFDFNPGAGIDVRDDYGNLYDESRGKLSLSGTWIADSSSHGLNESMLYKIFELAGATNKLVDYTHLRVVDQADETSQNGDFWGIYLIMENLNGDLLSEHDLTDGDIYKYKPTRRSHTGEFGPYTSEYNAWFAAAPNANTVSWWRNNLDTENHFSYMAAQEVIANGETNYIGQHHYTEYYNPDNDKWQIWPGDFDLTWLDHTQVVRGPLKVQLQGHNALNIEFQNRVREVLDLLYNNDEGFRLIDNESWKIYNTAASQHMVDADNARWGQRPGSYSAVLTKYRNFFVNRKANLETQWGDAGRIPNKPTISYTGPAGYPLDNLIFQSSSYGDPQGHNFAALQWRIGEVSRTNLPAYSENEEPRYEITPVWTSPEVTNFTSVYTLDGSMVIPGHNYRARVRYKDTTGRWSRWSNPIEFVANAPSGGVWGFQINELHYNPIAVGTAGEPGFIDGDEFEFLELKNNGNSAFDLSGVRITDGVDYIFPEGSSIPGNGYVVIAANATRFQQRYGFAPLGEYSGQLKDGGERVAVTLSYGALMDEVSFLDVDPWEPGADGTGFSLSLIPGETDNSLPEAWGRSADLHGTPKAQNVVSDPPIVTITAPANNVRINPGTAISIQVSANDPDAGDSIDSVLVYSGELRIGKDVGAPYQASWSPPPGGYIIEASAWDNHQLEGVASPIFITVATANPCAGAETVVVNEISYGQPTAYPSGDWVELYNPGLSPVDLSGWVLKDSQNEHWYVIPDGTTLGGYEYLVIARDLNKFNGVHDITNVIGGFDFGFGSTGDTVRLINANGCEIDFVPYIPSSPWPANSSPGWKPIELKDTGADNSNGANWKASTGVAGSPGVINGGLSSPAIAAIPTQDSSTGETINLGLSATDPNGPISWIVQGLPNGLMFNGNNASPAITGSPLQAGTWTVTVIAVNDLGLASKEIFTWNVESSEPTFAWFAPANGGGYPSGAVVSLEVDVDGPVITTVKVFVDGTLAGTANKGTDGVYRYTLSGLADGPHALHIEAVNSNNETYSPPSRMIYMGTPATGPFLEAGGRVIMEGENFDVAIPRGSHQWTKRNNIPGFSGTGFMKSEPDNGTVISSNYQSTSPEINYKVRFETPGTYTIWFRSRYVGSNSSAFAVGIDGTVIANPLTIPASGVWRWDKVTTTFNVSAPGQERLIQVWMNKDGAVVDKIVIDDGSYTPSSNGPQESARQVGTVGLAAKAMLAGSWSASGMSTGLLDAGVFPTQHPYAGIPAMSIDAAFMAANPTLVDWVWIELRTGLAASTSVYKGAFLIQSDGSLMDNQGSASLSLAGVDAGNYYVILGHRNHLAIRTQQPVALSGSTVTSVDFTTGQ